MKNIIVNYKGINIVVDYYVELYGVISILTNDQQSIQYSGQLRGNDGYYSRVLKYFSKYKDSKICKTFKTLSKEYYINFDGTVRLFLQISNNNIDKKEVCRLRRNIPAKMFNDILKQIKDFESESNFKEFFESEQENNYESIKNFINSYEMYSPYEYLMDFIKLDNSEEKNIVLMHGVTSANYGIKTNGKLYCCIRPYKKSRFDTPDFAYDTIYFTTLIIHEFAHSYINQLVEKEQKLVKQIDKSKYDKIMSESDYGSYFETYIYETIIRAIECIYVKDNFNNEFNNYIQGYIKDGFIVIDKVVEKLIEYQKNIKNYKNIDDIIPDLISVF